MNKAHQNKDTKIEFPKTEKHSDLETFNEFWENVDRLCNLNDAYYNALNCSLRTNMKNRYLFRRWMFD